MTITEEMKTPAWWNANATEKEKEDQDGAWWTGWARAELPDGTVLVACNAQGGMEGYDLGPIEYVDDVEVQ